MRNPHTRFTRLKMSDTAKICGPKMCCLHKTKLSGFRFSLRGELFVVSTDKLSSDSIPFPMDEQVGGFVLALCSEFKEWLSAVFQSHARIGVMAVLCEARDAALVSGLRADSSRACVTNRILASVISTEQTGFKAESNASWHQITAL
jgi:hypothetical protein